jgi:uncharacterized protein (TIGR03545 family)
MIQNQRWQKWVTRLLFAAVVFLAAQFGIGLVVRSLAIRTGGRMLGGGVEIQNARVSLIEQQVVLSDLRVQNPRAAGDDLFTADRCELPLAPGSLLHKRAIVTRGRVTGLQFSAFDAQPASSTSATDERALTINWLGGDSSAVATQWFAHLAERFNRTKIDQFESVDRTEAFCAKWAKQSAELEARGKELNERIAALQSAVEAAQSNPLRGERLIDDLPAEIAALQKDFADLNADLETLPDQLEAERRAIVAARRKDETLARQRVTLEPVEANALSAYLLRTQAAKPVEDMLGWLRWLREAAPAEKTGRKRGEDLLFAGCDSSPQLIVRSLDLRGTARIANQPVEVRGTLSGLSTEPALMAEPLRLRLQAAGPMPIELQATADRSHGAKRDSLLLDCQGVLLPQMELGAPGDLGMTIEPSVASLSVSVALDGVNLTGDIQMVQKNVRLKPIVAGSMADLPIAGALQDTLGRIDALATRIALSGTIAEPTCTLWSNLGPATAEAIERAVDRASGEHARSLLTAAGQQTDERLTMVERQISDQQARWANRVAEVHGQLRVIATKDVKSSRLTPARLGQRLPSNSLFR